MSGVLKKLRINYYKFIFSDCCLKSQIVCKRLILKEMTEKISMSLGVCMRRHAWYVLWSYITLNLVCFPGNSTTISWIRYRPLLPSWRLYKNCKMIFVIIIIIYTQSVSYLFEKCNYLCFIHHFEFFVHKLQYYWATILWKQLNFFYQRFFSSF